MDPKKWKQLKRSGNFKRKVQKAYKSLKNSASTSSTHYSTTSVGQESVTESSKGSVQTLFDKDTPDLESKC